MEQIIEMRFNKDKKREFLVRWKKWSSNYDSWEPEDNLKCPELIEAFMEEADDAKTVKKKDLRVKRKRTDRFSSETGRRLRGRFTKKKVNYGDSEDGSESDVEDNAEGENEENAENEAERAGSVEV